MRVRDCETWCRQAGAEERAFWEGQDGEEYYPVASLIDCAGGKRDGNAYMRAAVNGGQALVQAAWLLALAALIASEAAGRGWRLRVRNGELNFLAQGEGFAKEGYGEEECQ